MTTSTSDAGVAARAAATPQTRLFDCLDAASKERVTMLLSHYQTFLPVEQASFMQELDRYNEEQKAAALARNKAEVWTRYTTPRLQAVQARDPAYVQRLMPPPDASCGSKDDEALEEATAPCSLEDLLRTRGMFGEPEGVSIHVGKMSLYEKLQQNMRNRRGTAKITTATISTDADAGEGATRNSAAFGAFTEVQAEPTEGQREAGDNTFPKTSVQSESGERAVVPANTDALPSNTSSNRPTAPYRSNAYQAVRLSMSSPGYTATRQPTSEAEAQAAMEGVKAVLNSTAFPISEEELRDWFEELDVHRRGVLSVEEFQRYMKSLERDLGVPTEYATLEHDAAHVAKDGLLNFEAFSYLVLRFVRV
ncbi:hypothetical protein, conserved [Leishmania tarentolae]|uniref:EF-hand domain-containing protein n=1 Tax=Leishmania tarentolae TaxID=5689 RepID=A0A640KLC1_LEITA|nr:hypothetical protein, conserved [Leishmania tarentolae]